MPATKMWNKRERRAWALPEAIKPSAWAEKYRILPRGQSDIPGPWRNDNAPYLRGIMDLSVAPGVIQVNTKKAGQFGLSEAYRTVLLYCAHIDPDPVGIGFPDRVKGRKIVANRIIPAFQQTPVIAELFTENAWDVQREQIRLMNGFLLHLMWAGSPSATSSDPMRRVLNDEVDKPGFQNWGGAEPNPIGRTATRLRSYGERRVQLNASTPTDRFGQIHGLCIDSDYQLYYTVPCPFCETYQRLLFSNLKWERIDNETQRVRARRLLDTNAVWYECVKCGRPIGPEHKAQIVRAGRWDSENGEIIDAEKRARWPRGTRLAMQIGAQYCLWESWVNLAVQFIQAEGKREKTYVFRTESLGECWEQQMVKARPSLFGEKCRRAPLAEGIVPEWAAMLLAAVDTQHDYFYVVLRAWGPDMRSQRVWHGQVDSFAALDDLCLKRPWPVEAKARPPMLPELVLIDSGGTKLAGEAASRTMEVYRWAIRRGGRVRAIKGATKARGGNVYMWPGKGFLDEGLNRRKKDRRQVRIWFLDTHHWADLLADLIVAGMEGKDTESWLLNKHDDDDYNSQMANVHKVLLQEGRQLIERWVPVESGVREDYHDCEVYQVAAAYMAQVHLLPSQEELEQLRAAQAEERQRREHARKEDQRKGRPDPWQPTSLKEYL